MEEEKFCSKCGAKLDNNSAGCPNCASQDSPPVFIEEKEKFYQTTWFLWVSLILFWPLGLFLLWKVHNKYKMNTKIIITIVWVFLLLIGAVGGGDKSSDNTAQNESPKSNVKVTVADFSTMTKEAVSSWCSDNKINCNITKEYSDTVPAGKFISQSAAANKEIKEGSKVTVVYSIGKEPSLEFKNALNTAQRYSDYQNMSKQAIFEQLVSEYGEGFPKDAAQYAVDNMEADWNANALKKAETYANTQYMSKQSIYEQLTSSDGEKFTKEQAQYAINNLKADWNKNALEKAKSYSEMQHMSKQAIYEQLTSSYGEKFTKEQAQYAVDNLFK